MNRQAAQYLRTATGEVRIDMSDRPSAGQVLTALHPDQNGEQRAAWQTPSGSGGGGGLSHEQVMARGVYGGPF